MTHKCTAIVLTQDEWLFDCCGVVVGWKVKAGQTGDILLQTWTLGDVTNGFATMSGFNNVNGEYFIYVFTNDISSFNYYMLINLQLPI